MRWIEGIWCGNCLHFFVPDDDDKYVMGDSAYADCPECDSYNHLGMQKAKKCSECGRVRWTDYYHQVGLIYDLQKDEWVEHDCEGVE